MSDPTQPAEQSAPPAENKEEPAQTNEAKEEPTQKRGPYTGYKLYGRTEIQTGRKLREPRQKAILFTEISLALFGRRRFKRIDLICTLNNFYSTLSLASIFHRRVKELEKVPFVDFVDEKDTQGQPKEHSIFRLTLTKYPTQNDKNSVGFNEAYAIESISDPLTGLPERRQRRKNPDRKNDKKRRKQDQEREHEPKERREPRERREKDQKKERRGTQRQNNDTGQNKGYYQQRSKKTQEQYQERPYKKQQERNNYRQDRRDRPNESRNQDRREQYRDRQHQKSYYQRSYKQYVCPHSRKHEQSRDYQKKEEANYRRGETKTRGTGRIAGHNYEQGHIRQDNRAAQKTDYKGDQKQEPKREERTEGRGDRAPKKNRYSDDEDW